MTKQSPPKSIGKESEDKLRQGMDKERERTKAGGTYK
jgi:hypothetical protein